MPDTPFFSIIIPCYNQAHWLRYTLGKIREQHFKDWEAIVINDGSTDDTRTVAESIAAEDKRIRVFNQLNKGLSGARNTGIQQAQGMWIQFHDADDFLLTGCLDQVAKRIQSRPHAELFQVGHDLVDEKNTLIQHVPLNDKSSPFWPHVKNGNPGPPLSFFIHRNLLHQAGMFDETLTSVEDWDFWIRVGKLGAERETISTPLVAYRYLSNSMSRNPWRMFENNVRVIERIHTSDDRINHQKAGLNDANNDLREYIKIRLIQSLGLCVMQGNIDDALQRFRTESRHYHLEFKPADFRQMNSFMTFKNLLRKSEVNDVLEIYPNQFSLFFAKTYFSTAFQEAALFHVFIAHQKKQNRQQYGIFGRWKNWKLDNRRRALERNIEKGY
jgi:glycosyltransferase involved in cell wall biosynthesis